MKIDAAWRWPLAILAIPLALAIFIPAAVTFYLWRAHRLIIWWKWLSKWWAQLTYNLFGAVLVLLSATIALGRSARNGRSVPENFNVAVTEIVGLITHFYPDKGF